MNVFSSLFSWLNQAPQDGDEDESVRRFGYSLVFLVFGFGGLWMIFAPLESAALAVGTVQVEGNRKVVQHLEGGVVSEILVKNGSKVVESQALLVLEAAKDRADQQILVGRIYSAQAQLNRLQAERDELSVIAFADELLSATEDDERAKEAVANEMSLFRVSEEARSGEKKILEQRIGQLSRQIEGLGSVVKSKKTVLQSLQNEIEDLSELLKDGYVDRKRIRELQRTESELEGEISDLEAKTASSDIAISEIKLKIFQLKKEFKSNVVAELAITQSELYDLQKKHTALTERVERATVKAPVSGTVMAFTKNTLGAVVRPGETLMEVVPGEPELVVKVQISPMDIDRVRIGQNAEVRFSVFKDAYTITGTLEEISADSITDADTGIDYYSGEVSLWEDDLSLLGGLELVPGMPADVLIKTGRRTLLGYVTSPLNRMFANSLIEE